MPRKYLLFLLLAIVIFQSYSQSIFKLPIEGVYGKDWFIVNHVDEDTTNGFVDAFCGTKSYNGHYGTDFVIRNFNHMDDGVNVLAPANGVVFKTQDGQFDRNKKSVIANGFGNYIGIKHTINGQNYYTYYAHLKKGSLKVDSGDIVTQGQVLAQVGSSGNSEDPHLHFEVYNDTVVLDPWDAPCQFTPNTTLWIKPPAYDTSFAIISYGAFQQDFIPFLDTLREPKLIAAGEPFGKDFFVLDTSKQYRTAWFLAKGVRKDDTIKVVWNLADKNKVFTYVADRDYWYFYFWDVVKQDTLKPNYFMKDNVSFYRNEKQILGFVADGFLISVPEIEKFFSITATQQGVEFKALAGQNILSVSGYTLMGQKLKISLEQTAAHTWLVQRSDNKQPVFLQLQTTKGVFTYKWMPVFFDR